MENIKLTKEAFDNLRYNQVIDTSFNELRLTEGVETGVPSVDTFFYWYEVLFYNIPRSGSEASHQTLVQRSGDYINEVTENSEVQALLEQIADLEQQNATLSQELVASSVNPITLSDTAQAETQEAMIQSLITQNQYLEQQNEELESENNELKNTRRRNR